MLEQRCRRVERQSVEALRCPMCTFRRVGRFALQSECCDLSGSAGRQAARSAARREGRGGRFPVAPDDWVDPTRCPTLPATRCLTGGADPLPDPAGTADAYTDAYAVFSRRMTLSNMHMKSVCLMVHVLESCKFSYVRPHCWKSHMRERATGPSGLLLGEAARMQSQGDGAVDDLDDDPSLKPDQLKEPPFQVTRDELEFIDEILKGVVRKRLASDVPYAEVSWTTARSVSVKAEDVIVCIAATLNPDAHPHARSALSDAHALVVCHALLCVVAVCVASQDFIRAALANVYPENAICKVASWMAKHDRALLKVIVHPSMHLGVSTWTNSEKPPRKVLPVVSGQSTGRVCKCAATHTQGLDSAERSAHLWICPRRRINALQNPRVGMHDGQVVAAGAAEHAPGVSVGDWSRMSKLGWRDSISLDGRPCSCGKPRGWPGAAVHGGPLSSPVRSARRGAHRDPPARGCGHGAPAFEACLARLLVLSHTARSLCCTLPAACRCRCLRPDGQADGPAQAQVRVAASHAHRRAGPSAAPGGRAPDRGVAPDPHAAASGALRNALVPGSGHRRRWPEQHGVRGDFDAIGPPAARRLGCVPRALGCRAAAAPRAFATPGEHRAEAQGRTQWHRPSEPRPAARRPAVTLPLTPSRLSVLHAAMLLLAQADGAPRGPWQV